MSDDEIIMKLDLNADDWTLPEGRAYRKAVGVNVEYASEIIRRALTAAEQEARETFGDAVDDESWAGSAGWVPLSILNIDPDYLLGLYWIRARRDEPGLEYETYAERIPYGKLAASFWDAMSAAAEEAVRPLEANRATRRANGQRSKTASRSRTSTAGRSATSTVSPTESSPEP